MDVFRTPAVALVALSLALPHSGASQSAEDAAAPPHVLVWVTAQSTNERLASRGPVDLEPMPQPEEAVPTVIVDPAKTFQAIEGIGGALTDASAETWAKLPPEAQQRVLEAYFDPVRGNGYSLARTHINSCDFSSEGYAYDAQAGDVELRAFTIEHDRRFRLPFIKAALARAGAAVKIFASPWSPPAWMKTNNDMLQGGRVKPEYRDAWARYFVRFVQEYEKEGVPIWGLTVQNEPMASQTWESCLFSGPEERDFVRDHLGPALERAGLSRVKLMIWDHNRGILYQRAKAVYDDPAAARYVWGTAFHWYVGDHFDNVRVTHEAWPDKPLVMTEGTPANFSRAALAEWKWGEVYGRSLMHDLGNGASGWTDWNVLLDEQGGPNHLRNYCLAPVHADTRSGQLTFTSSYYYLGHFSRFVRPGARRVAATSNDDDLLAVAFANPDGRLATVIMNATANGKDVLLWMDGRAARTRSPAHSILTLVREP
jgi:glucosylceramidase